VGQSETRFIKAFSTRPASELSPEQVVERVRETGAPVTPFIVPRELPHSISEWWQYHTARIEAGCTVSTFVFMIAGWFAPRVGLGQTWANIFFMAAYIAGGVFGVKASLDFSVKPSGKQPWPSICFRS